uniref:Nucleoside phosphorylase domain-containing protein n=1 Tax=Calcidiscus leptoporus TaxID=127549 RepID=A0A7S0JK76_9EUKA|mmetsp:Transcript_7858/g.18383  ORF Transcript_7858/g.18383 Transcript_7858/m.18383 type:complete len:109 (+) Transcript_7858:88-414(+)
MFLWLNRSIAPGVDVVKGRIATGSVFLSAEAKQAMFETVWKPLGEPMCAEMENAAVAQICCAYGVPYLSLRAISDLVTGDAAGDFNAFCATVASHVFPIVRHVVQHYE